MKRSMLSILLLILGFFTLVPATLAQDPPQLPPGITSYDDLVALYDYDTTAPLDIEEVSVENQGEVAIHDITFKGGDERTISAYLIVPPGDGPFPAVLWVHWYAPTFQTSNRTQYYEEALHLAEQGVLSLLVSTAWSEDAFWTGDVAENIEISIQQVVDLRRALDLLTALEDVDADRIAYVGHDFGAIYGANLSGVDMRVKAFALIAPAPYVGEWFARGASVSNENYDQYVADHAVIDPIYYLPFSEAALFFQFADYDPFVRARHIEAFLAVLPTSAQVTRTYDGNHELDEVALQDRTDWLVEHLTLTE